MKAMMNKLLEALRERVTENLVLIRQNEQEIRKILTEPLSNQRSHNLSNRHELSRKILQENRENLNIQNKIVAFLSDYKDLPAYTGDMVALNDFENEVRSNQNSIKDNSNILNELKSKVEDFQQSANSSHEEEKSSKSNPAVILTDEQIIDSLFRLTINGELAFNSAHPRFNDDEFYNKILNYHIEKEEYEICAKLVKTRN